MAERVVDLRSRKNSAANGAKSETTINWVTKEFDKKQRSKGWHLLIGGLALTLVVVGIFAQSYFFVSFVVIAYSVLLLYESKKPAEWECSVTAEGVRVGRSFNRFSELRSFWIFQDIDPPELSLHTRSAISPYLRVTLKGVDLDRIRLFLNKYLPEEEHKDYLSDEIERSL